MAPQHKHTPKEQHDLSGSPSDAQPPASVLSPPQMAQSSATARLKTSDAPPQMLAVLVNEEAPGEGETSAAEHARAPSVSTRARATFCGTFCFFRKETESATHLIKRYNLPRTCKPQRKRNSTINSVPLGHALNKKNDASNKMAPAQKRHQIRF